MLSNRLFFKFIKIRILNSTKCRMHREEMVRSQCVRANIKNWYCFDWVRSGFGDAAGLSLPPRDSFAFKYKSKFNMTRFGAGSALFIHPQARPSGIKSNRPNGHVEWASQWHHTNWLLRLSECHSISEPSLAQLANYIRAKYIYGNITTMTNDRQCY